MAYLPRSVAEKNIVERKRKSRDGNVRTDYEVYIGRDPFTQKTVRLTRNNISDLRKALYDFYYRHKIGGDAAVFLNPVQAIDARNAYAALTAAELKVSLYDVAKKYIEMVTSEGKKAEGFDAPIIEAFAEYYKMKPEGADKLITDATTGKWARKCGDRMLSSVTAAEIHRYLDENYSKRKPKTYNQHLLYLKTFFNWCCKPERKYLNESPLKLLKFKPVPWEEPEYMKPADVESLFRLLESVKDEHPEMLAYAVVNFFCGSRNIEIQRMACGEDAVRIDLDGETIRIAKGKGFQQGRRPRAFHIEPTALAWMKSFDFLGAILKVTEKTQLEMYKLARANKVPVFQNCGRHTFITYHVAAYGDPAKTQAIVGTSERMRSENYCGLATKADGEAFFRIMPKAEEKAVAC